MVLFWSWFLHSGLIHLSFCLLLRQGIPFTLDFDAFSTIALTLSVIMANNVTSGGWVGGWVGEWVAERLPELRCDCAFR